MVTVHVHIERQAVEKMRTRNLMDEIREIPQTYGSQCVAILL